MSATEPCPFCLLASSRIIASNDLALAIRDSFPLSEGHTLIVPRRHVSSWFDATEEEQLAIIQLMNTLLDDQTNGPGLPVRSDQSRPDGYNIGINVGAAAGQTVMHLHVHLIPRREGDCEDPRGGIRWVIPERAKYWENGL